MKWGNGARMQHDNQHDAVEPLTRHGIDGAPYRRTAEVERQIAAALPLDPPRLLERARIADPSDPGYLREEALVYFIRAARRADDRATLDALFAVLVARCARLLTRRLGSLGPRLFEDACADCAAEVAERILDLDHDRGDFFQVRFWVALERLAITVFQRHADRQRAEDFTMPLDDDGDDDRDTRLAAGDLPDIALSSDQRAEYRDALAAIPEPARTAFVLRHYHGWPVEDHDPSVPTISRYFGKTGRTIRNYLRHADEALLIWRGDGR